MPSDTITISRTTYDKLVADRRLLNALYAAGVDNWEGFPGEDDDDDDDEDED